MGNCSGKSNSNKTILPKIIAVYFIIIQLSGILVANGQTNNASDYRIRTVVIDAGHGGRDPGAVGKLTYEKHITLAVALKLGELIKQHLKDVKVIYTRSTDVFIPLDERSEIANTAKADVFISVHVNSLENPSVSGTSSWVMGLHVSDENFEIAQRENSVIMHEENHQAKYEGYDPSSSESYIIFSLMQNEFLDQSLQLASRIQQQFATKTNRINRGVNQAGFVVLWKTSMPSVLVETGFISNLDEEKYLASGEGQAAIALAIFNAFKAYKNNLQGTKNTEIVTKPKVDIPEKKIEAQTPRVKKANKIEFAIQLKSSPVRLPLQSQSFKLVGPVFEQKEGGLFKYYCGRSATYAQVNIQKNEARKVFKDAFVVAFENNTKIAVSVAVQKQKANLDK